MKPANYFRLFVIVLVAVVGLAIFAYARASRTNPSDCPNGDKSACSIQHTELMIWESLSHNLLGNSSK